MSIINDMSHVLPCVVQLGFAGSRRLFDLPKDFRESPNSLYQQVQEYLCTRLGSLSAEIGLAERNYFLCGISQIAVGADTLFTLRVAIPELAAADFLAATPGCLFGSRGNWRNPRLQPRRAGNGSIAAFQLPYHSGAGGQRRSRSPDAI